MAEKGRFQIELDVVLNISKKSLDKIKKDLKKAATITVDTTSGKGSSKGKAKGASSDPTELNATLNTVVKSLSSFNTAIQAAKQNLKNIKVSVDSPSTTTPTEPSKKPIRRETSVHETRTQSKDSIRTQLEKEAGKPIKKTTRTKASDPLDLSPEIKKLTETLSTKFKASAKETTKIEEAVRTGVAGLAENIKQSFGAHRKGTITIDKSSPRDTQPKTKIPKTKSEDPLSMREGLTQMSKLMEKNFKQSQKHIQDFGNVLNQGLNSLVGNLKGSMKGTEGSSGIVDPTGKPAKSSIAEELRQETKGVGKKTQKTQKTKKTRPSQIDVTALLDDPLEQVGTGLEERFNYYKQMFDRIKNLADAKFKGAVKGEGVPIEQAREAFNNIPKTIKESMRVPITEYLNDMKSQVNKLRSEVSKSKKGEPIDPLRVTGILTTLSRVRSDIKRSLPQGKTASNIIGPVNNLVKDTLFQIQRNILQSVEQIHKNIKAEKGSNKPKEVIAATVKKLDQALIEKMNELDNVVISIMKSPAVDPQRLGAGKGKQGTMFAPGAETLMAQTAPEVLFAEARTQPPNVKHALQKMMGVEGDAHTRTVEGLKILRAETKNWEKDLRTVAQLMKTVGSFTPLQASEMQSVSKLLDKEINEIDRRRAGTESLHASGVASGAKSRRPNQELLRQVDLARARVSQTEPIGFVTEMNTSMSTASGLLKKYRVQLKKTGESVQQVTARVQELGQVQTFRKTMSLAFRRVAMWGTAAGLTYGLVSAFRKAFRTIQQVEKGIIELAKVMRAADIDFKGFSTTVLSFAQDMTVAYGTSLKDALGTMAIFARQGLEMAEVQRLTEASILAANVTVLDQKSAAEALTAAIRQFNLDASDAVGIIDKWNEVAKRNAVTEGVLTEAIKKVGSAAAEVGVQHEQLLGMVTAIGTATRHTGRQVGTSLRFIFQRSMRPGTEAQLNKLGVATRDLMGNFRGFNNILGDLATKWDNFTQGQKLALAQAMGGVRQYNSFLVLMRNYDLAIKATNEALHAQGSAQKENQRVMISTEKKLQQLSASAQRLAVDFGGTVLPAVKGFTDGMREVLSVLNSLPDSFKAGSVAALGLLAVMSRMSYKIDMVAGYGTLGGAGKIGVGAGISRMFKGAVSGIKGAGKPIEQIEASKSALSLTPLSRSFKQLGDHALVSAATFSHFSTKADGTINVVKDGTKKMSKFNAVVRRQPLIFKSATGEVHKAYLGYSSLNSVFSKLGVLVARTGQTVAIFGAYLATGVVQLARFATGGKLVTKSMAGTAKATMVAKASTLGLAGSVGALVIGYMIARQALKLFKVEVYKTGKETEKAMLKEITTRETAYDTYQKQIGALEHLNRKRKEARKFAGEELSMTNLPVREAVSKGTYTSPIVQARQIAFTRQDTVNMMSLTRPELLKGIDRLGNAVVDTSLAFSELTSIAQQAQTAMIALSKSKVAEAYAQDVKRAQKPLREALEYLDTIAPAARQETRVFGSPDLLGRPWSEQVQKVADTRTKISAHIDAIIQQMRSLPKGADISDFITVTASPEVRQALKRRAEEMNRTLARSFDGLDNLIGFGDIINKEFLRTTKGFKFVQETADSTAGILAEKFKVLPTKIDEFLKKSQFKGTELLLFRDEKPFGLEQASTILLEDGRVFIEGINKFSQQVRKEITEVQDEMSDPFAIDIIKTDAVVKQMRESILKARKVMSGAAAGIEKYPVNIEIGTKFITDLGELERLQKLVPSLVRDTYRLQDSYKKASEDLFSTAKESSQGMAALEILNLNEQKRIIAGLSTLSLSFVSELEKIANTIEKASYKIEDSALDRAIERQFTNIYGAASNTVENASIDFVKLYKDLSPTQKLSKLDTGFVENTLRGKEEVDALKQAYASINKMTNRDFSRMLDDFKVGNVDVFAKSLSKFGDEKEALNYTVLSDMKDIGKKQLAAQESTNDILRRVFSVEDRKEEEKTGEITRISSQAVNSFTRNLSGIGGFGGESTDIATRKFLQKTIFGSGFEKRFAEPGSGESAVENVIKRDLDKVVKEMKEAGRKTPNREDIKKLRELLKTSIKSELKAADKNIDYMQKNRPLEKGVSSYVGGLFAYLLGGAVTRSHKAGKQWGSIASDHLRQRPPQRETILTPSPIPFMYEPPAAEKSAIEARGRLQDLYNAINNLGKREATVFELLYKGDRSGKVVDKIDPQIFEKSARKALESLVTMQPIGSIKGVDTVKGVDKHITEKITDYFSGLVELGDKSTKAIKQEIEDRLKLTAELQAQRQAVATIASGMLAFTDTISKSVRDFKRNLVVRKELRSFEADISGALQGVSVPKLDLGKSYIDLSPEERVAKRLGPSASDLGDIQHFTKQATELYKSILTDDTLVQAREHLTNATNKGLPQANRLKMALESVSNLQITYRNALVSSQRQLSPVIESFRKFTLLEKARKSIESIINELRKAEDLSYDSTSLDKAFGSHPLARTPAVYGQPRGLDKFQRQRLEAEQKISGGPFTREEYRTAQEEKKKIDFSRREALVQYDQSKETAKLKQEVDAATKALDVLYEAQLRGVGGMQGMISSLKSDLSRAGEVSRGGPGGELYFRGVPSLEGLQDQIARAQEAIQKKQLDAQKDVLISPLLKVSAEAQKKRELIANILSEINKKTAKEEKEKTEEAPGLKGLSKSLDTTIGNFGEQIQKAFAPLNELNVSIRELSSKFTELRTGRYLPTRSPEASVSQNNTMRASNRVHGGLITGPAGIDKVPANLTAGEYVVPKQAVMSRGKEFFDAVSKNGKGYRYGGEVIDIPGGVTFREKGQTYRGGAEERVLLPDGRVVYIRKQGNRGAGRRQDVSNLPGSRSQAWADYITTVQPWRGGTYSGLSARTPTLSAKEQWAASAEKLKRLQKKYPEKWGKRGWGMSQEGMTKGVKKVLVGTHASGEQKRMYSYDGKQFSSLEEIKRYKKGGNLKDETLASVESFTRTPANYRIENKKTKLSKVSDIKKSTKDIIKSHKKKSSDNLGIDLDRNVLGTQFGDSFMGKATEAAFRSLASKSEVVGKKETLEKKGLAPADRVSRGRDYLTGIASQINRQVETVKEFHSILSGGGISSFDKSIEAKAYLKQSREKLWSLRRKLSSRLNKLVKYQDGTYITKEADGKNILLHNREASVLHNRVIELLAATGGVTSAKGDMWGSINQQAEERKQGGFYSFFKTATSKVAQMTGDDLNTSVFKDLPGWTKYLISIGGSLAGKGSGLIGTPEALIKSVSEQGVLKTGASMAEGMVRTTVVNPLETSLLTASYLTRPDEEARKKAVLDKLRETSSDIGALFLAKKIYNIRKGSTTLSPKFRHRVPGTKSPGIIKRFASQHSKKAGKVIYDKVKNIKQSISNKLAERRLIKQYKGVDPTSYTPTGLPKGIRPAPHRVASSANLKLASHRVPGSARSSWWDTSYTPTVPQKGIRKLFGGVKRVGGKEVLPKAASKMQKGGVKAQLPSGARDISFGRTPRSGQLELDYAGVGATKSPTIPTKVTTQTPRISHAHWDFAKQGPFQVPSRAKSLKFPKQVGGSPIRGDLTRSGMIRSLVRHKPKASDAGFRSYGLESLVTGKTPRVSSYVPKKSTLTNVPRPPTSFTSPIKNQMGFPKHVGGSHSQYVQQRLQGLWEPDTNVLRRGMRLKVPQTISTKTNIISPRSLDPRRVSFDNIPSSREYGARFPTHVGGSAQGLESIASMRMSQLKAMRKVWSQQLKQRKGLGHADTLPSIDVGRAPTQAAMPVANQAVRRGTQIGFSKVPAPTPVVKPTPRPIAPNIPRFPRHVGGSPDRNALMTSYFKKQHLVGSQGFKHYGLESLVTGKSVGFKGVLSRVQQRINELFDINPGTGPVPGAMPFKPLPSRAAVGVGSGTRSHITPATGSGTRSFARSAPASRVSSLIDREAPTGVAVPSPHRRGIVQESRQAALRRILTREQSAKHMADAVKKMERLRSWESVKAAVESGVDTHTAVLSRPLAALREGWQKAGYHEWAPTTSVLKDIAEPLLRRYHNINKMPGIAPKVSWTSPLGDLSRALREQNLGGALNYFRFSREHFKNMIEDFIRTKGAKELPKHYWRGPVGKATGGLIKGPGTEMSDSIPALLEQGSFVLRAKATKNLVPAKVSSGEYIVPPGKVKEIGLSNLEKFNDGRVGSFAEGGLVGSLGGILSGTMSRAKVSTNSSGLNIEKLASTIEEAIAKALNNNSVSVDVGEATVPVYIPTEEELPKLKLNIDNLKELLDSSDLHGIGAAVKDEIDSIRSSISIIHEDLSEKEGKVKTVFDNCMQITERITETEKKLEDNYISISDQTSSIYKTVRNNREKLTQLEDVFDSVSHRLMVISDITDGLDHKFMKREEIIEKINGLNIDATVSLYVDPKVSRINSDLLELKSLVSNSMRLASSASSLLGGTH